MHTRISNLRAFINLSLSSILRLPCWLEHQQLAPLLVFALSAFLSSNRSSTTSHSHQGVVPRPLRKERSLQWCSVTSGGLTKGWPPGRSSKERPLQWCSGYSSTSTPTSSVSSRTSCPTSLRVLRTGVIGATEVLSTLPGFGRVFSNVFKSGLPQGVCLGPKSSRE